MKAQVSPHFLFNALNSLVALSREDPKSTQSTLVELANLYQKILEASRSTTIELSKELAIVESYLKIQKIRFGDRLKYSIETADMIENIYLPGMLIQTLVENAVKHGVEKSRLGGHVLIRVLQVPPLWRIEVTNSGAPLKTPINKSGTGIVNSEKRLEAIYGPDHKLVYKSIENGQTQVTFTITGEKL